MATEEHSAITAAQSLAMQELRQHCEACHGLGDLRFINSDDDQEMWDYILSTNVPNTNKLWIKAMIPVLSWPSDEPPPFDQYMDPATKSDWMPRGYKRIPFATDTVDTTSFDAIGVGSLLFTRHFILGTLSQAVANLPTTPQTP